MEAPRPPTIIPMWITGTSTQFPYIPTPLSRIWSNGSAHTGFDKLMPEGRRSPWKFLPRPGARLSVTFGPPLSPEAVRAATMASGTGLGLGLGEPWRDGESRRVTEKAEAEEEAEVKVRVALTELVQRAVEGLGRQVSGDLLDGSPPDHHRDHQQRT
jgi:monolysocardiolipin acyltransferase